VRYSGEIGTIHGLNKRCPPTKGGMIKKSAGEGGHMGERGGGGESKSGEKEDDGHK